MTEEGPRGWAVPLHARVLDAAGVGSGTALLDVGCGAGGLARAAVDRGAAVAGVDVDRRAVAAAAAEVPEGDFRFGDAHDLAWPAGAFDVVAAVQLLAHVANPLAVLREAARVAGAGGAVVVTVWGRQDECDVRAFGEALAAFLPGGPARRVPTGGPPSGAQPAPTGGPPSGAQPAPTGSPPICARRAPGGPPLTEPDRLRKLARLAGLEVTALDEVVCAFRYPDDAALLGPLLASGLGRAAVQRAGPAAVRDATLVGLARFRESGGGYRLDNLFRVLSARVPG